ncbi:DUF397 domain-containing protein [Streptomyces sp. WAC 00631]|uniref:DUF397 domain-containing protein n=1 Tax=Streptomyces sp. WAC 00631 TaxID=2203201 RepID=UPI000F79ED4D|nr:DUF397 domain-containing protein [Streptomyces sp. WAC 00631]MCC5036345.1 DUF397 domain-containing protein [Streptomyces sp. WAC 00631]
MSADFSVSTPADLYWFKSSYSGSGGGDCVEVAATPATVRIRDSKNRQGPVLGVSTGAWSAFVTFAGGRPRPEL